MHIPTIKCGIVTPQTLNWHQYFDINFPTLFQCRIKNIEISTLNILTFKHSYVYQCFFEIWTLNRCRNCSLSCLYNGLWSLTHHTLVRTTEVRWSLNWFERWIWYYVYVFSYLTYIVVHDHVLPFFAEADTWSLSNPNLPFQSWCPFWKIFLEVANVKITFKTYLAIRTLSCIAIQYFKSGTQHNINETSTQAHSNTKLVQFCNFSHNFALSHTTAPRNCDNIDSLAKDPHFTNTHATSDTNNSGLVFKTDIKSCM